MSMLQSAGTGTGSGSGTGRVGSSPERQVAGVRLEMGDLVVTALVLANTRGP
jgi:hypothetical protein